MSCIAGIFPIAFPGERKDCGLFATFYIWWDVRANRRNTGRTTFERWSYQKIASLLASERLECSPLAHSWRLETRSNILAVYRAFSIFLLRIDGILFSFVSFPLIILFFSLSPSLYFSLFLCIHIYIYIYFSSPAFLRNEDRISRVDIYGLAVRASRSVDERPCLGRKSHDKEAELYVRKDGRHHRSGCISSG